MRLALLALATLTLCACERACARDAIERARQGGASPVSSQAFPLNAVDCPDGLARCRDGVVESSRLFAYPVPCTGPAERCTCPWDRLAACDHGCVVEDVIVALPRDRAFAQLCAPPPSQSASSVERPAPAASSALRAACDGELYRCIDGQVIDCVGNDGGAGAFATCARGCVEDGAFVDEDRITRDQAALLLCQR